MHKRIDELTEGCMVGEFSDSTVRAFIKSALYKFGEECFTAAREEKWHTIDEYAGHMQAKYNDFQAYLKATQGIKENDEQLRLEL
jgi:hypothetical protein